MFLYTLNMQHFVPFHPNSCNFLFHDGIFIFSISSLWSILPLAATCRGSEWKRPEHRSQLTTFFHRDSLYYRTYSSPVPCIPSVKVPPPADWPRPPPRPAARWPSSPGRGGGGGRGRMQRIPNGPFVRKIAFLYFKFVLLYLLVLTSWPVPAAPR